MARRWGLGPILPCPHRETLIERRRLPGGTVDVRCFVCLDCGYAAPVMRRTDDEHARIVAAGQPAPLTAKKAGR